MRSETHMVIMERHSGDQWETIGGVRLTEWEAHQISLILSGIDPGAFAALPAAAQARVLQNIDDHRPPSAAMI